MGTIINVSKKRNEVLVVCVGPLDGALGLKKNAQGMVTWCAFNFLLNRAPSRG